MNRKQITAHIFSAVVILLWGSAIVASKIALQTITAVEVVVLRFFSGYLLLWILRPRWLKLKLLREELFCLICGVTGVSVYFLLQNIAMSYTSPSNVSIILALSPLFTAICSKLFGKDPTRIRKWFYIGFAISLAGVIMVVSNGSIATLRGGLAGDLLVLVCTISWGLYSVIYKKLQDYPAILLTRRIFFYGLVTMIPVALIMGFSPGWDAVLHNCLPHILYMGFLASAVAYFLWNYAVSVLGPVTTDIYRYAMPVATVIFSAIFLDEHLTWTGFIGIGITLAGLLISQLLGKGEARFHRSGGSS